MVAAAVAAAEPQPFYQEEEEEARPSSFASAHLPRRDRWVVVEPPVYFLHRVCLRLFAATSSETSIETTNANADDVFARRRASRLSRDHRTAHAAAISISTANATRTANANAVRTLFSTATDSSTDSDSNRVDLPRDLSRDLPRPRVHDDPHRHRLVARTRPDLTLPPRVRTPSRGVHVDDVFRPKTFSSFPRSSRALSKCATQDAGHARSYASLNLAHVPVAVPTVGFPPSVSHAAA